MATDQDIDIDLLSVDLGNFRLGEYEDVRAVYQAMLDEQKEKLVNLATDILDNGLSPAERLIVVPDEDEPGHFIVCEGNRRLTAIRLMDDPRLAVGHTIPRYVSYAL
ncbi:Uknown, partial [mine drainage metagenome]